MQLYQKTPPYESLIGLVVVCPWGWQTFMCAVWIIFLIWCLPLKAPSSYLTATRVYYIIINININIININTNINNINVNNRYYFYCSYYCSCCCYFFYFSIQEIYTDSLRLVIPVRSFHLAGNIRKKGRSEILISSYWRSHTYATIFNRTICDRKVGLVSPSKRANYIALSVLFV